MRQLITEKMDEITDELYYEIMVGPEAYELVPHVKVVLETLAVSDRMTKPWAVLVRCAELYCAGLGSVLT